MYGRMPAFLDSATVRMPSAFGASTRTPCNPYRMALNITWPAKACRLVPNISMLLNIDSTSDSTSETLIGRANGLAARTSVVRANAGTEPRR